jgi:cleavage and polyadenylation specificity factor subunit 2
VGNSEVLEDDYGIAVIPEHFIDIVTGVDPSKFAGGSGRIGEEVLRRGFGFGVVDNAKGGKTTKRKNNDVSATDSFCLNPLRHGMQTSDSHFFLFMLQDDMEEGGEEEDERGLEAADLSEGRGIIRGRNGRPPTKVMTVPRRLQVFAEIAYIPLEGRVDSRAARQSVRALQPRQVVVLGGPKDKANDQTEQQQDGDEEQTIKVVDEVQLLASAAEAFTASNTVVQTPSDFETVELDVGHAAYSVRLIDAPYASRDEKQADNAEPPEPIEPYEAKLGACTVSLLDYVATGQRVALDGSIVLAPRAKSSKPPSIYLSDGEVLLTDLRSELIAQGMKAEYSAHTGYSQLVVNSKIVVRKDQDSGKVDVEGPLCEDFFTVRSVVCGQYVTLY